MSTTEYSLGASFLPSASALPRPSIRLGLHSLRNASLSLTPIGEALLIINCTDYSKLCSIAKEVLEQKAICQQDPDQDADEEAPEDQAEYDSVLISSAGDLVAAMANALGADFATEFDTFHPLVAKYYVRVTPHSNSIIANVARILYRKRTAHSATDPRRLGAWPKLSLA